MKIRLTSIGLKIANLINQKTDSSIINIAILELITNLIKFKELELICSLHPLGFIHFNIPIDSETSALRLHIWNNQIEQEKTQIDIHDHYYDLNSYVICGEIENLLYDVNPSINGEFVVFLGSYNLDKTNRILVKTNEKVNCDLISRQKIYKGNYYFIDKDSFHNSVVQKFTSTIVLINNFKEKNEPKIIGSVNFNDNNLFFPKKVIDKSIIIRNLRKVASNIRAIEKKRLHTT